MRRPLLAVMLILNVLIASAIQASVLQSAKTKTTRRPLIVVVANRITLSDLDSPNLPTISKMLRLGSVGLVSPNCTGAKSEDSLLLTANAGTSSKATLSVRECYDSDEALPDGMLAADEYALRMGSSASNSSASFSALGPLLRSYIENGTDPTQIGACGEALHKSALKTCAIGNADLSPKEVDRRTAVLAMDSKGLIDFGYLSDAPTSDGDILLADPQKLIDTVERGAFSADFVVVDFGDTRKYDNLKPNMSDSAYEANKTAVMRNLDSFINGMLTSRKLAGARVILVSFSPPQTGKWDQLTPIIVYPSEHSGLLTSSTTRTPGLVAASDFAPTVLQSLNVPIPPAMTGAAVKEEQNKGDISTLTTLEKRISCYSVLIHPILWFFALVGAVSLTGAGAIVALSLNVAPRVGLFLRVCMLVSAAGLLAMLLAVIAPAGPVGYMMGTVVSLIATIVIALLIGMKVSQRSAVPILAVFSLTTLAIIIDSVTGCSLCKFAVPSSYQLSGFRYYGIGNEYAAALIGMAAPITVFASTNLRIRKILTVLLGVVIVIALGLGSFGANYSAMLAAVVTFGLLGTIMWQGEYKFRHIILYFLLGAVLVVVSGMLDAKFAGNAGTHSGKLANLTSRFGAGYLMSMVTRKLLLNLRLSLSHTALMAYLAFIPLVLVWVFKVREKVNSIIGDDRRATAALKAIVIGAVTALLIEDSGIVMGGIILGMQLIFLLFALMEKQITSARKGSQ